MMGHPGILASGARFTADKLSYVKGVGSFEKMINNYSGYSFRVRRALDNAELDIPFDGMYADISTFTSFLSGSNGFVSKLYDQKSGNDWTATTTIRQPRVLLATVGGVSRLVMRHTGSQAMSNTVSSLANINGGTITTITANVSGNNPGFIAGWGQWSPGAVRANYLSANKYFSATGGASGVNNFDTTIAETVPAIFTTWVNRNNPGANTGVMKGYVNGVKKVDATGVPMVAIVASTNFGSVFGQTPNNTEGFKGDILALIRTDDLTPESEIIDLHLTQKAYYGI